MFSSLYVSPSPTFSEINVCSLYQAPNALFFPLKESVILETEILLLKTIESNSSEIGERY